MTTTPTTPTPAGTDTGGRRSPGRGWGRAAGVGAAALLTGALIGSTSGPTSEQLATTQARADVATDRADGLAADLEDAQEQIGDLRADVAEETARADDAEETARATVQAEFTAREAELDRRDSDLDARATGLDKRERKVTGMERAWAQNTIPGDGIFLVGSDVTPGVYKAAASPGCYYARLKDSDSWDNIIDNNNVDGPVAVTIAATDHAFEVSGCGDFHKVG